jgi:hypothetical protein
MFASGGLAILGHALGGPLEVVATAASTIAVLACVATPTLTRRLARFPTQKTTNDGSADDPFTVGPAASVAQMPSAEQVWARVRAIALGRAGVLAGLAGVVVLGSVALLRIRTDLSAFVFALACAGVLALRSRKGRIWPERAALGAPAVVLTVIACVLAQDGATPLRFAGIAVLVTLAILAGFTVVRHPRLSTVAAYLEYIAVAAVVPLALWPLGVFERLGRG